MCKNARKKKLKGHVFQITKQINYNQGTREGAIWGSGGEVPFGYVFCL